MKFIIVFAAIIAFAYGEYKVNEEMSKKIEEEMGKMFEKCIKDENISEADIKEMEDDKMPSSKAGKCMISCVFQTIGAQDKDGKMTKDSILKTLAPYKDIDMNLYIDMNKVLIDCLPEVKSADRCDAAFEITACYHKNATPEMVEAGSFL